MSRKQAGDGGERRHRLRRRRLTGWPARFRPTQALQEVFPLILAKSDLLQGALQWLGTRGLLGLFLAAFTTVLRALLGFGAEMKVALVNDGPVTIWLDTASR